MAIGNTVFDFIVHNMGFLEYSSVGRSSTKNLEIQKYKIFGSSKPKEEYLNLRLPNL